MKRSVVEHAVFGVLGGLVYMGIEVLWRGRSHPTMLLLGGVCFVVIGRLNERQGCAPPLWAQAVAGAAAVTLLELATGLDVYKRQPPCRVWPKAGLFGRRECGGFCYPAHQLRIELCLI